MAYISEETGNAVMIRHCKPSRAECATSNLFRTTTVEVYLCFTLRQGPFAPDQRLLLANRNQMEKKRPKPKEHLFQPTPPFGVGL